MGLKAITQFSAAAAAFASIYALSTDARADHLDACGGLFLEADAAARCELVTKESCEQQCEPVAVERVCAARLFESCESECSFTAEVECQAGCEQTCVDDCVTTEEPPNCMGLCMSDCQQDVTAKCGEETGHGECRSSGAQCCQENCDAQCDGSEQTECDPVCDTACSASCVGRANIDCQVECQSRSFVTCKDELVVECNEQCETTGAALFCDGHFLLTEEGDLQACADQLLDEFGVEIDVDVDVDIDGDDCDLDEDDEEKIEDALSCSVSDPDQGELAFGLLVLFGIGAWRIRRVRRELASA
jgi:MYXO-CTERM domain-containing protein